MLWEEPKDAMLSDVVWLPLVADLWSSVLTMSPAASSSLSESKWKMGLVLLLKTAAKGVPETRTDWDI